MATLLLLALSLTLFGIWAHRAVAARDRLKHEQWRMQSVRLAEASLKRALIMHTANPEYKQDSWKVPADHLDNQHTGQIEITVAPGSSNNLLRLQATAECPAGAVRRVQTTRSIEIPTLSP